MKDLMTRAMVIATLVILGVLAGIFAVFREEPMAYWLMGTVAAIWACFLFMAFLLQQYFQRPWDEKERRLAELVAQTEAYRLMFGVARKVGEVSSSADSLERSLQASVETLRDELKLDGCSVRMLVREDEPLEPVVGCGYRREGAAPVKLPPKTGVAWKAIQERRPVFVEDPSEEKAFLAPAGDGAPVRSLFCVPLIEQGEVVGVLSGSCRQIRRFSPYEREVLEIIANRMASLLRLLRSQRSAG